MTQVKQDVHYAFYNCPTCGYFLSEVQEGGLLCLNAECFSLTIMRAENGSGLPETE